MTKPCCSISLAVATVDIPAGEANPPTMSHLAAIAMLIAERDTHDEWHFTLERQAICAGDSEDLLLVWATHAMPDSGIVLGWHLADTILPPLLDAGTAGNPEIGRAFLDRLTKLVTAPSVDLAIPHGGSCAPSFDTVVAVHGMACPAMTAGEIESAWAFGQVDRLRDHVEAQAIATWRLWLAESNGTAAAASAAFAAWLNR